MRGRRSLGDGPWLEPVTFSIGMLLLSGHYVRRDDENDEWRTGHFSIGAKTAVRLAARPAPVPWRGWADQQARVSFPGVFPETGGTLTRAKRLDKPGNVRRETHVQPRGDGIVTIVLPACTDCDAKVAIRTGDGRKLSNSNELTVGGPGG